MRGADVFVIQSLAGTRDGTLSLNDALMELVLMVDAAVGASAHRVIAVIPWFGYSRQDMKSRLREPISARAVARMLESVGVSRVLTVDLHTGQAQGFFRVPVDHMTALHTLTEDLGERLPADAVVVAPGRRPREARQEVRDPPRRRARDPRPRGHAREPPRDRRGHGAQDRHRRRHHRHRQHADRRGRGAARRAGDVDQRGRDAPRPQPRHAGARRRARARGAAGDRHRRRSARRAGLPARRQLRRPAGRHHPPDLRRRVGRRGVRRRQP